MRKPRSYRCCFVPMCKNTSKNAPNKVFVIVPRDEGVRRLWFRIARRPDKPTESRYYCCDDHFDLKEDMDNYLRFSLMGGQIRMKAGAVPHIFTCQPDRKREMENRTPNIPIASETMVQSAQVEKTMVASIDTSREDIGNCSSVSSNAETTHQSFCHKGIQVNIKPRIRSKYISCNFTNPTSDANCSPIKLQTPSISNVSNKNNSSSNKRSSVEVSSTSVSSTLYWTTSSDFHPNSDERKEEEISDRQQMQAQALSITNYFISTNSKSYIGIPNEWFWIIYLLHAQTEIRTDHIKLTLMKIKVNDTFQRIGEQFGISHAQASNIFKCTIPRLAHMLKTLIYFPDAMSIRKVLPIPFRANYSNVQSIIDCFEIQIQKPTNSVHQALTWSEYKKSNTLKYLISSTPDGFINFVSTGYGGRISDTLITEKSGFLNVLPDECGVMADRGFKQIQSILNRKKCILIRPPTVSSNIKPSKAEVLETKRIASLRIHIERVIRRLREYEMLKPHACIHHDILRHVDSIVLIASALINLQPPIIKQ